MERAGSVGRLAEFEAADFSGGGAGELGDKFEAAGAFVVGEARGDEVEKIGDEGVVAGKAGAENDEGDGLGEMVLVFVCHDGDLGDGFVFEENVFDFGRAEPDARDLEHVVGATGEPVVAIGVLIVAIASGNPMTLDDLFGALVAIPVSGTGGVAFEPEDAVFAGGDGIALFIEDFGFVAGNDAARGTVTDFAGDVGNKDVKSFRGADAIEDLETETFSEAFTKSGGERFTGGDAETNAGEIEITGFAVMVDEGGVIGGHGEEERGVVALDGGENVLGRGRAGEEDGSAADSEGEVETVAEAVGEEEFGGGEEAIGFADFENAEGVVFGGVDHIVLEVDAALGEAGAAGGVKPESGVVFASGGGGEIGGVGGEEIGEGESGRLSVADNDDGFEEVEVRARNLKNEVRERFADDGDTGASVVEEEFVFIGAKKRVDGNGDGANLDSAEEAVSEFGDVGQE